MPAAYLIRFIPPSSCSTAQRSCGGGSHRRPTECRLNVSTTNPTLIDKITLRLSNGKVELSPSAYDTAWVAMVPTGKYSGGRGPCFPQCLDWVMENQNPDGSWGLNPGHPTLVKDSLSCTLACVLALHKWSVGQQLVKRGLNFIGSNGWAAFNKDQFWPIGFEIVFPAMVNHAKQLDLALPLSPNLLDWLFQIQDLDMRNPNLNFAAEGLGDVCNWKKLLTHQKSNGSLFNSPATSAAALIHTHDDKCFEYLTWVLQSCNGWVPTIYPMDISARVCLVDTLERMGIDQYFEYEVGTSLDEIYRSWQAKDDEMFADIKCLAMAFRLLRMRGYDVSSEAFAEYVDQEHFFNTISIQYHGVTTCLELYRASQIRMYEEESILEKIHAWTSTFLKQQLLNRTILDKQLHKQVERDLMNFHGTLDQVVHRQSIESYDAQDFQMLKTAYRCPTIHNEDFILCSVQHFRIAQSQFQKEFKQMERWYTECRLDHLNQGRNTLWVSYMFCAAAFTYLELPLARITLAQCTILITCLDDFIDVYGSKEEAFCIMELVRKWEKPSGDAYKSPEVEILFTALYDTINEIAAKADAEQGRCVKHEIVKLWLELIKASMRLKGWDDSNVSMLEEYMTSACITIACKLYIFTVCYFLGVKLSEDMFTSVECTSLWKHVALVCRLLNDLGTFKREDKERVLNSVGLQMVEGNVSEEEAIFKLKQMIEFSRRKVLQMVYQSEGNIPKECKEIFWKMCKIGYCLYPDIDCDEFTTPEMIAEELNSAIWEPLGLERPSLLK